MVKSAGDAGLWMAQVLPDSTGAAGASVTAIRLRPPSAEGWADVVRLPGRVASLASRGSQLAVLQESGDWLLVWQGGTALGQPLPAKGKILELAGDSDSLWAIGLITGQLPASRPTTATTAATSAPAVELEPATTQSTAPRTLLFRLSPTGWTAVGPIDVPAGADVAMAAMRDHVYTAIKLPGKPTAIYDGTSPMLRVNNPNASRFTLLPSDGSMLFWTAKDTDAGEMIRLTAGLPGGTLVNPTGLQSTADRTVEISTGRLRLFFMQVIDGKQAVMEQKYDSKSLQLIDTPTALVFPQPHVESKFQNIFSAVVLAAMVFAMIASFQHRRSLRELLLKADHPIPAPLLLRLVAGAIDLLPMVIATLVIVMMLPPDADPSLAVQDPQIEGIFAMGMAAYLLHTTLTEAIFGRSIGKMVMGLKIVDFEGKPASVGARIARNFLRIIELAIWPMAGLMIVSPLRQRAGDIAAGTIVVSAKDPSSPPPLP